ncbi:hypothetical protein CDAR_573381 [Caerostris darwini]|uniref:Uncharacterized protein n=1 Tax=Caerostris darwini TaxID=1538125 RepID=A0AAV4VNQ2_9ARAC|nr:hypothetical protein CDAR_573381 [Caerostris darwini]
MSLSLLSSDTCRLWGNANIKAEEETFSDQYKPPSCFDHSSCLPPVLEVLGPCSVKQADSSNSRGKDCQKYLAYFPFAFA